MKIITLITKNSVREILSEKKFLKFYTSFEFKIGNLIEIIEGNKKALAIILKIESAQDLKQALRSGSLEIKKLKLSKTGKNADGKIIKTFTLEEIKKKKIVNQEIKNFFPKKRIKKNIIKRSLNKKTGVSDFSNLSLEQYKNKPKTYYSETQELVDIIRKHFQEKAVRGTASFSYYIGFFKKIPQQEIKQFFAEAQQSKKPISIQKRIFWKKIGDYLRSRKNKKYK